MHFERTLRGGLWEPWQGLGAGVGLGPVALTSEGHWGGDALRGCLGSWDSQGGDGCPSSGFWVGEMVGRGATESQRHCFFRNKREGHLGLRAGSREYLQGRFLPWLPVEP